MDIKRMNAEISKDIKKSETGMSHGLETFIKQVKRVQEFNAQQPQSWRPGEEYRRQFVTVYFSWITNNRLNAYIVIDGQLECLVIPEAGWRLYANYKDGYQANGGGYSKPNHILEAMVFQAKKHMDLIDRSEGADRYDGWQSFIRAEVI